MKFPVVLSLVALTLVRDSSLVAQPESTQKIEAESQSEAASSRRSFEEIARQAARAREEGHLNEAIPLLERALGQDSSWTEGWWLLGASLYDLERYSGARVAFRRLLDALPGSGVGWALKGLCEYQLRDYEKALADLRRASDIGLTRDSEVDRVANYHFAILLTRFGEYETASAILVGFARDGIENVLLTEALGLAMLRLPYLPSELPAEKREMILMAGRAGIYSARCQDEAAREAFEELVVRYSETPNVHYAYGVHLLRPDADAALKEFQRELNVSPKHVHAMLQIAFEHISRADYQAALPLAQSSVELSPSFFAARLALGQILLETGDVARAIEELEAGVRMVPDCKELRFFLRRAYLRAGRAKDAAREQAAIRKLEEDGAKTTPLLVGVKPGKVPADETTAE